MKALILSALLFVCYASNLAAQDGDTYPCLCGPCHYTNGPCPPSLVAKKPTAKQIMQRVVVLPLGHPQVKSVDIQQCTIAQKTHVKKEKYGNTPTT